MDLSRKLFAFLQIYFDGFGLCEISLFLVAATGKKL